MASIYEKVQTPKELLMEVMAHGLSTKQEDIFRVQDIFGRAPIEDLVALANDIGRNNENGEPDPRGSLSSGRRATQGTFYMVLSNIWNWEDMTRFWNEHTNPEHEKYVEMYAAYQTLLESTAHLRDELDKEHKARLAETSARIDADNDVAGLKATLHERDMEIIELKARLYDMMMKGVE